jgi:hypothetical protein
MVYKWKSGSRFSADAQRVGNELRTLGRRLSAPDIVEAARDGSSELHKCFEWNNSRAAEAYRLVQGRKLLHSIIVVSVGKKANENPIEVRAYESVSVQDDGSSRTVYVPLRDVLSDEDMRDQVFNRLSDTISEASATTRKYRKLIGANAEIVERHLEAAGKALAR